MENLNGPYSSWYDKAHLLKGKTAGWTKADHEKQALEWFQIHQLEKVLLLERTQY